MQMLLWLQAAPNVLKKTFLRKKKILLLFSIVLFYILNAF